MPSLSGVASVSVSLPWLDWLNWWFTNRNKDFSEPSRHNLHPNGMTWRNLIKQKHDGFMFFIFSLYHSTKLPKIYSYIALIIWEVSNVDTQGTIFLYLNTKIQGTTLGILWWYMTGCKAWLVLYTLRPKKKKNTFSLFKSRMASNLTKLIYQILTFMI